MNTGEVRLDVALTIRRSAAAYAHDFAAFALAGFALVTLPGLLMVSVAAGNDWNTLAITLRAVCAMLYVALVSWGVVARLRGAALTPLTFVSGGLVRAQPGLQVALLIGAGIVAGLTVQLFARHGTVQGWLLDSLLLTGGLWAASALMPLVPVAVVERLGPLAAIHRSAALTAGNRNRTLMLALLIGLTLAPAAALVFGFGGSDHGGIWLRSLFELLALSLIATVPAVVYAGLQGPIS